MVGFAPLNPPMYITLIKINYFHTYCIKPAIRSFMSTFKKNESLTKVAKE